MMAKQIENYLRKTGETPCQFGRRVAKDPNLVSDIKRGRMVGPKLRSKIVAALGGPSALAKTLPGG